MKRGFFIAALAMLPTTAIAQDVPTIAIVRPGAGYLVADSRTVIPLQIVLTGKGRPNVKRAKIVPSQGKVTSTRVIGEDRVELLYQPPRKREAVDEILDVSLVMSNGNRIAEAFTLLIPPPRGPDLEVSASPQSINAAKPTTIGIAATTSGEGVERLELMADKGKLAASEPSGGERTINRTSTLELPQLPPDAPSHFMVLAAASSASGYSIEKADISVLAPVRVSVEIAPGSELVVEGAEIEQEPVTALADGRTVMEDVIVRYGRRVRVFEQTPDDRQELSVVIPSGLVSFGVAMPLPGQNVADGGTGPTIAVAIPPSPFGDEPFWADIELEGAKLVGVEDVTPNIKVLIVERPSEAKNVRVLMDEEPIGEVAFGAALGQFVRAAPATTGSDERGGVEITVTDASANPADHPVPKVRIEGGKTLTPERIGVGRYRASIPPGTPGKPGDDVEIVAELAPPPRVAGDTIELSSARTTVKLGGPPPAIKSEEKKIEKPPPTRRRKSIGPKLGVSGAALVGTSFNSLLVVGGGVMAELRLPFLDHRMAVRAGLEFQYGTASGRVQVEESQIESRTTVSGVLVPIDFGFAILKTKSFELIGRAGVAIRIEQGGVTVGSESAGGGSSVGIGARAGGEAGFLLGDGALFLGATLGGLGASANGLSAPGGTKIDGSLTTVRAEVGYRVWF